MARTLKKENIERILHEPSIIKGIVIMAIPVFLNNLLKSLHDLVDAVFIARMPVESPEVMDSALAALNIHWPIFNFFMALGIGLSIASVSIVSQYLGANRKDLAKSYASKLVFLSILLGILITGIFLLASDLVLGYNLFAYLMGARGDALKFAGEYFRIRSFEFVFVFIFLVYQAIRQASGETLRPVLLNISGIFVNIVLTWLFVSKLGMGISGAAYATLIAQIVVVPLLIIDLFTTKKYVKISLSEMALDKEVIKDMGRFAVPASVGQAVSSLGFVIIQSIILSYGDHVSAGFSVGNRISSLLLNPVVAISSIMAAYIGLNIGHHQPERAKKSYQISRNLSLWIMVIGISIIIPLRNPIIVFIIGTSASRSFDVASEYTVWILLTQPLMAIFQSHVGLFNGAGRPNLTLRMSMVRLWFIRVPLVLILMWILPKEMYQGIFYAMMISNIAIVFYGHYLEKQINYEVQVRL
ncbi:MAG: MATE family efflux transporter [Acholeplasmataceae bacterium]